MVILCFIIERIKKNKYFFKELYFRKGLGDLSIFFYFYENSLWWKLLFLKELYFIRF